MNSALQVIYMNPVFRQVINSIKLYNNDNLNQANHAVFSGHKHEILTAIQRLFAELQMSNKHHVTTKDLTKAFRWDSGEGRHQQDSQEFIRLFLFEVIENIFKNTEYFNVLDKVYKIKLNSFIHCTMCQTRTNREETSYDMILTVQNINDIRDALHTSFGYNTGELIDGFKCDSCGATVTIQKGSSIKELPMYLFINLQRFEFDFQTFERVKLNSKVEFPLELDMLPYVDQELFYHREEVSF